MSHNLKNNLILYKKDKLKKEMQKEKLKKTHKINQFQVKHQLVFLVDHKFPNQFQLIQQYRETYLNYKLKK